MWSVWISQQPADMVENPIKMAILLVNECVYDLLMGNDNYLMSDNIAR